MNRQQRGDAMQTTVQTTRSTRGDEPQSSRQWNPEFLKRHNLLGHMYRRTHEKIYYPYWKSQLNRNSLAKQELQVIGRDLQSDQIQVFLLKGFSLMGEIYKDWGERFVSDIDLLISHAELWKLTDILCMYGYQKRRQNKWLENRHKHIFVKMVEDVPITIEVHTQLFWHTSMNIEQAPETSAVPGFYQLSHENQLIHLCGHLAFQHSYSKLFWLMDIFKYVDRFRDIIQWDLFWEQAEKANLYKSCFFTLFLCQKLGLNIQTILFRAKKKKKVAIYFLKKAVDYSYLYDPQKHPLRQWLVKVLIKDSIFDNVRYAYAWLRTFRARQV
jgi:hypothetical protein